jgi:hypothetical protein
VGQERGPLSLVSTTEEVRVLEIKSSGSGLENREYGRKDMSRRPRGTLYPQKLALTSPTSGNRSVGIVRSRTQAKKFSLVSVYLQYKRSVCKYLIVRTHLLGLGSYSYRVQQLLLGSHSKDHPWWDHVSRPFSLSCKVSLGPSFSTDHLL